MKKQSIKLGGDSKEGYRQKLLESLAALDVIQAEVASVCERNTVLETKLCALANEKQGLLQRIKDLVTENKSLKNEVAACKEKLSRKSK